MLNTTHPTLAALDTIDQLVSDTLSESPTPTQYYGTEILEANCAALIAAQRLVLESYDTPADSSERITARARRRAALTQLLKDQIWGDIVVNIAREQGWILYYGG